MAHLKQDEWPADREPTTAWEQVHCADMGSHRFAEDKPFAVDEQDRAREETAAGAMQPEDGSPQGLPPLQPAHDDTPG